MVAGVSIEVLDLCVKRGGWRKGPLVAEFCAEWLLAERELGPDMLPEAFGEWWKDRDVRTAYRRIAAFRELFPELGEQAYPRDLVAEASRPPATVKVAGA